MHDNRTWSIRIGICGQLGDVSGSIIPTTLGAISISRKFVCVWTAIQTMTTVHTVVQLAQTVAVSTAVNESSFSCLKRILTPYPVSMMHQRKADLILLALEKHLTRRVQSDGERLQRL